MNLEVIDGIAFATVRTGTPLLLIAMGTLISEKSGVLNLGQEGMVLLGAASAFAGAYVTGNPYLGCLIGVLAGAAAAALFALLALGLRTNQVATGLALTIFGTGLAGFIGSGFVGESITGIEPLPVPVLDGLWLIGEALFSQDPIVYLSFLLFGVLWWILKHTRVGLRLTAVGHNPGATHQLGYPVLALRTAAVLAGGALAGLAGAYLSVVYTPLWSESISAGRGWIGLALVVFASWRVERVLLGAYLFGLASIGNLLLQTVGVDFPPNLLAMLPYVVTIVALVLLAAGGNRREHRAPAALGSPYHPGD